MLNPWPDRNGTLAFGHAHQWKRKEGIGMPEIGRPPPPDGYPEEVENAMTRWGEAHGEQLFMGKRAPPKKDTAAQDKAAQSLYLVETRARYGEIIVSHPVILL
jgi:carbon catabolite-derepressing protein kinase